MMASGRVAARRKRDALTRRLGRWLLGWRFRLFEQHRHNRLVIERIASYSILVLPQVLNPKLFRTGEFLALALDETLIPPGSTVLDMGTGSGICAVFAARWASGVVAVDISPAAVRCARINALLNHVDDRVQVCEGDLFGPVHGQQFDVVLFNPPFFRGMPRDDLERALWSPDIGARFASGLADHLKSAGYALVVLSTEGDGQAFLDAFRACGLDVERVGTRVLLTENLTIYRIGRSLGEQP
jgi:HemK-related putative methylase